MLKSKRAIAIASTAIGLFQDSNLALIMGASTYVASMVLHGVLSE